MRYMFNISDEEKKALLDQHKQPYNGYQTLQAQQPDNRISVYDPAGDKKGVQVTANGGVRTYSNFNLRESKADMCECGGMMYEGECMECGYKPGTPAKLQDKFDYVAEDECTECGTMMEGEMCSECGSGMMYEGECNECGYTVKNPETMYSQGFDYMSEEVSASLQEPYSSIDLAPYDFDSKGPEQFGDEDMETGEELVPSFDSDGNFLGMVKPSGDMELDGKEMYSNEKPAYEFDSPGPYGSTNTFEEVENPEGVKKSIQESLNWFKRFSKFN